MENVIDDIKYKGYNIRILEDDDADNPRNWDNLGIIAYANREFLLGEEEISNAIGVIFDNWNDLELAWYAYKYKADEIEEETAEELMELGKKAIKEYNIISLPVYIYNHSGIAINTVGFRSAWDSNRTGFIYTDKNRMKMYMCDKADAKEISDELRNEIEIFDNYLAGDTFVYKVSNKNGETVNIVGGYYGSDDIDIAIEDAKEDIDNDIHTILQKRTLKLKTLIKKQVPLPTRERILMQY